MLEDDMEEAERLRKEVANLKKEIHKLEYQHTINERIKYKIQKLKNLKKKLLFLGRSLMRKLLKQSLRIVQRF